MIEIPNTTTFVQIHYRVERPPDRKLEVGVNL